MKVYTFVDKGGLYARGAVEVGGYKPHPSILVGPVTLSNRMVEKANLFNVTTSGATVDIELNLDTEAGVKILIAPSDGCQVTVPTGGTVNAGAATLQVPIVDTAIAECLSMGGGVWLIEEITVAGVRTAPTPAAKS